MVSDGNRSDGGLSPALQQTCIVKAATRSTVRFLNAPLFQKMALHNGSVAVATRLDRSIYVEFGVTKSTAIRSEDSPLTCLPGFPFNAITSVRVFNTHINRKSWFTRFVLECETVPRMLSLQRKNQGGHVPRSLQLSSRNPSEPRSAAAANHSPDSLSISPKWKAHAAKADPLIRSRWSYLTV